jgi:hypothetical protein
MNLQLERALRAIGGLIVAALVAFLLFRFGTGWGLGGSGAGEGEGSGAPTKGGDQPNTAVEKQPPTKVDPTPPPDPAELASGLRVTIMRAGRHPQTFRFEGDREPVDLAAARERLRTMHEASMGRLKFLDLVIYRNSTAEGHPDIQTFEGFAHDLGLRTGRQKLDQNLPD